MNLTEYTTRYGLPNGKTFAKPQINLLFQMEDLGVQLFVTDNVICRNPVSGYSEIINPLLARLIEWTYEVYSTYDAFSGQPMNYRGKKVTIQTYDRVRMLVLSLDSNVYSNFLD